MAQESENNESKVRFTVRNQSGPKTGLRNLKAQFSCLPKNDEIDVYVYPRGGHNVLFSKFEYVVGWMPLYNQFQDLFIKNKHEKSSRSSGVGMGVNEQR